MSSATPAKAAEAPGRAASRRFRFEYTATVASIPAEAKEAAVWIPLPSSDGAQSVEKLEVLAPVPHRETRDRVYGNRMAYVSLQPPFPPAVEVRVVADIERREVQQLDGLAGGDLADRLRRGDRLAPLNDTVRERAREAVSSVADFAGKARALYDRVLADVDYDKSGAGWGRGDLEYVCSAGKGNCSDFHSYFIALARAQDLPALFEIGFAVPAGRREGAIGGYHCWAWYQDASGSWRPVDASEADKDPSRKDYFFGTLCANRVAFSRGRDLVLEPPQESGELNFFIYPHVEVDGKAGVAEVTTSFQFQDLD